MWKIYKKQSRLKNNGKQFVINVLMFLNILLADVIIHNFTLFFDKEKLTNEWSMSYRINIYIFNFSK